MEEQTVPLVILKPESKLKLEISMANSPKNFHAENELFDVEPFIIMNMEFLGLDIDVNIYNKERMYCARVYVSSMLTGQIAFGKIKKGKELPSKMEDVIDYSKDGAILTEDDALTFLASGINMAKLFVILASTEGRCEYDIKHASMKKCLIDGHDEHLSVIIKNLRSPKLILLETLKERVDSMGINI